MPLKKMNLAVFFPFTSTVVARSALPSMGKICFKTSAMALAISLWQSFRHGCGCFRYAFPGFQSQVRSCLKITHILFCLSYFLLFFAKKQGICIDIWECVSYNITVCLHWSSVSGLNGTFSYNQSFGKWRCRSWLISNLQRRESLLLR